MVYVLLADGFEEIEALTPIDILKRCGAQVITAGVSEKNLITGAHDIKIEADILIDDIKKECMDCLIVPGGAGYVNIEKSAKALELIKFAAQNNILLCAICAAPSILGKLGILKERKAVCFPGYEKELKGAEIVSCKVVADKNIITGKGAGAAADFGFLIAEHLFGKDKAEKIKATMQY